MGGRLSINPRGVNTFLWAHGGMSNELGYHGMNKGSYELNLRAKCNVELPTLAPSISNAPSISDAPSISAFPTASVESTFPSTSEMPVTFYTLDPTDYPTETPQCKDKNQPCEQKRDCCKKKCGGKKG